MPGGGHTLATNYIYNQAPKDGTTIGTVINSIPLHQAIGGLGVRYDAAKLNWIGSTGVGNLLVSVWHTAGVKTLDDAKHREVIIGATGPGSNTYIYANALNVLLGTKFRIVTGYRTVPDINLALSRGEVTGRTGAVYASLQREYPEWLKDGKIIQILQVGATRETELPDVLLLHEIGDTPELREIFSLISSPVLIGRPYIAPPDVPAERIALLRKAFMDTMTDPQAEAEALKFGVELNPVNGEAISRIVEGTFKMRPEVLARAVAAMGPIEGEAPKKKKSSATACGDPAVTTAHRSRYRHKTRKRAGGSDDARRQQVGRRKLPGARAAAREP